MGEIQFHGSLCPLPEIVALFNSPGIQRGQRRIEERNKVEKNIEQLTPGEKITNTSII